MTSPYLTLESVSYVLPDGRTLFSGLTEQFDLRPTGLVGRNGAGKSVLARLLAGQLSPASGRCLRSGSVHYLAQQVDVLPGMTVAGLAGAQTVLDALARIEAGSSAADDFEAVGERWDAPQRLRDELARSGLAHLEARTPANQLSGGEAMRVALIGAMLSDADFLILDEPTNHLDRQHRQALAGQLQRWPRGLLVVSHDRELLGSMTRIVELSSLGLRSYGGSYSFYAQCKAQERQQAIEQLEQRKHERQRSEQALREQQERQQRRQARGNRHGREANQAKILLDRQKARSEISAGRLQRQQADARLQLDKQVREAARQVEDDAAIVLHAMPAAGFIPRSVAVLEDVVLPYVPPRWQHINLQLGGPQRVGVLGPNGCGKSTLLKVLAGQLPPAAGRCRLAGRSVYLDQRLAGLAPELTVLAQMQACKRTATEGELRMWLAHLGLDAQAITRPSGLLSGGERLKAALACALYADEAPQLLLLDEPSNHLDLASVQALEALLQSYQGALVVVSHDEVFLNALGLTDRLQATSQGWQMAPW